MTLEERNSHIELVRQFGDQMIAEGNDVEFVPVATRGVRPDEVDARAPSTRRKQGWGAQKRRGIGNLSTAEAPAPQPLTKSQ